MNSKINVNLRKNLRAQLTKCVNSLNELTKEPHENVEEVKMLGLKIKHLRLSLTDLNEKIATHIDDDEVEAECEKITEYEMAAVEALSVVEIMLQKESREHLRSESPKERSLQDGNQGTSIKTVRLPKVELIKFDGSLDKWPAFWEQFQEVIHNNQELDTKSKFSYLKNQLTGKAALTISGILSTQSSYSDAIELLQSEFGKPDRIIDLYIRRMHEIPPVRFDKDATGLRRLYNNVISSVRSLNKLGITADQFGLTVKSIVLKALPLNLRHQFNKSQIIESNKSTCGSEFNTGMIDYGKQIESLLQFIKIELDALETAKDYFHRDHKENFDRERKVSKESYTAQGLIAITKKGCVFCKNSNHQTRHCKNSAMKLEEKKEILRKNLLCFRCAGPNHISKECKSKDLKCQNCSGRHLTVMCDPNYKSKKKEATSANSVTAMSTSNIGTVYLQTATAYLKNTSNEESLIRIIIDGGSQLTFIKKEVSRKLNLPVVGRYRISICPFGKSQRGETKFCNKVEITLRSKFSSEPLTISAIETPEICFDALEQPNTEDPEIRNFAKKNLLADCGTLPLEFPGISLLIGADNYWSILQNEFFRLTDKLTAVKTVFGWTLHGRTNAMNALNASSDVSVNFHIANVLHSQVTDIDDDDFDISQVKKFWDLETIGINANELTNENKEFTQNFMENNIKLDGERYEVTLPWKDKEQFDSNYSGALARVKSLVRKLCRERKLVEYDKAVREFLSLKCAEPVYEDRLKLENAYYLPHKAVYREDRETTKVRVVFDASAHGLGMPSLNDKLLTGDNLLPDILKLLLNFRIGAIALIADVEKAFLQIALCEKDRDFHRFLWFENPVEEEMNITPEWMKFQTFRMCRVT